MLPLMKTTTVDLQSQFEELMSFASYQADVNELRPILEQTFYAVVAAAGMVVIGEATHTLGVKELGRQLANRTAELKLV
jgi:hypothetical protein